jgi:transcription initiation factor IIE alpha subunit
MKTTLWTENAAEETAYYFNREALVERIKQRLDGTVDELSRDILSLQIQDLYAMDYREKERLAKYGKEHKS